MSSAPCNRLLRRVSTDGAQPSRLPVSAASNSPVPPRSHAQVRTISLYLQQAKELKAKFRYTSN